MFVYTWDDDQLVFDIFLNGSETADIIAYRIFVVCRTRSDDDKKTVVKTFDHIADLCVTLFLTPAISLTEDIFLESGQEKVIRLKM